MSSPILHTITPAQHDLGGLLGMCAAAHFKMMIGFRDFQLLKEDVRHLPVIVLSRVHELKR